MKMTLSIGYLWGRVMVFLIWHSFRIPVTLILFPLYFFSLPSSPITHHLLSHTHCQNFSLEKQYSRTGPVATWLSSRAPLWRPRVWLVRILGTDIAPFIRPCWGGVPHATREGPTAKNTQVGTWGLLGEKGKKIKSLKKNSYESKIKQKLHLL